MKVFLLKPMEIGITLFSGTKVKKKSGRRVGRLVIPELRMVVRWNRRTGVICERVRHFRWRDKEVIAEMNLDADSVLIKGVKLQYATQRMLLTDLGARNRMLRSAKS